MSSVPRVKAGYIVTRRSQLPVSGFQLETRKNRPETVGFDSFSDKLPLEELIRLCNCGLSPRDIDKSREKKKRTKIKLSLLKKTVLFTRETE